MTKMSAMALVMLGVAAATASAFAAPALDVRDAWVNPTVPGQSVAAAYMTFRSPTALRVVAIRSNVSSAAEIHTMSVENGIMRMRQVDTLAIPAGTAVALAPGAVHLMLVSLQRPLNSGDVVELEFTTMDEAGVKASTRVQVPVRQELAR